jgi:hypothetical protein
LRPVSMSCVDDPNGICCQHVSHADLREMTKRVHTRR